MDWYLAVLRKYSRFRGRAQRAEYWYFSLFHLLAIVGLVIIDYLLFGESISLFTAIYILGTIIPALAVSIRRLHDTGKSGWWYLITIIPFGSIVMLVFTLQDSQPGTNQYGANPKE